MTSLLSRLSLCLWIFAAAIHGDFVDPPPKEPLRSVAEEETVLPCRYEPAGDDVVVQVTWFKTLPDKKEQIITAHHQSGQTAFGTWSQRVRFKSDKPTEDSSLVITSTDVSDEGEYICHISTFPSGNFERVMSLIVWTIPITSLDTMIVVEGQSFRLVASCRSIARPPATLTWDTELNGKSTNRTSESGAVSIQYSLHPLRSMNSKKLDCLVWHPTLPGPRRFSHKLVVHFPPDAKVSGASADWYVGMENAALRCVSEGNPKPSFTWSRMGRELPKGVITHPNGTLAFQRPLNSSDGGTYQCVAKNEVGVGKAEVEISLGERPPPDFENMLMIIVGGVAGGLLVLMLVIVICVTCKQKRKNKRLAQELSEKKEEISTLSRHASFRRMNSVSTDARGATEENIPLRVEGTIRTSLSSLGELPYCRDSRSTISGGRGGGGGVGAFDSLGRPVLYNNSRRGRDRYLERGDDGRLRVDPYERCSSVSLETRFHPPLMPSPVPNLHSTELLRQLNGSVVTSVDGGSRAGSVTKNHLRPPASCTYPPVTDDEDEVDEGLGGPASQEHPDDRDSVASSSQVSEANSTRYQQTNGTLIVKSPISSISSPHASLIHKAQIV